MTCYNNQNAKEISIDYPLYQSQKGNYFIGQTPTLSGETKHALTELKNPHKSNRLIYLNAITLTNISFLDLSAEFYLRSHINNAIPSDLVSCVNTAIHPEPIPEGKIKYVDKPTYPPTHGVPIFSRIVSPNSTLVVDGGQIILGPGESIAVYIGEFSPVSFSGIKFAFGWWEEKIHNCNNYYC